MLGEREPPPKKQRKRKKQDQRYYIVFLCYILSLLSEPVLSTLSFLKLLCNKPQKKKHFGVGAGTWISSRALLLSAPVSRSNLADIFLKCVKPRISD